ARTSTKSRWSARWARMLALSPRARARAQSRARRVPVRKARADSNRRCPLAADRDFVEKPAQPRRTSAPGDGGSTQPAPAEAGIARRYRSAERGSRSVLYVASLRREV